MPTPAAQHAPAAGTPAPPRRTCATRRACLTVDVEEYFQCEVYARSVRPAEWARMERRAAPRLARIAELLARSESRATFFVLGWTVPYLAPLLAELLRRGHELACHGDGHAHLARLTPQELRDDLCRARDRMGTALGVVPRGYRAPTFSVTRATAWALDAVIDAGFTYDASIFPIHHDRYGVPDAPGEPFWAVAPSGRRILEFPPLTLNCGLLRLPLGGGGYLRILPGAVLRWGVRRAVRRGAPVMLYVHPWELDPDQPRLPLGRLAEWRHRVNLDRTEARLARLLAEFRFDTAAAVLDQLNPEQLPHYALVAGGPAA